MEIPLIAAIAAIVAWKDGQLRWLAILFCLFTACALLPEPYKLGPLWYECMVAIELLVIAACALIRHPAGVVLATLSVMNIIFHVANRAEFVAGIDGPINGAYHFVIPLSEFGQALTLLLFSPAIADRIANQFTVLRLKRHKDDRAWIAKPSN